METFALFWGGLVLGCWHALDADHVCTVSALLADRQPWRRALGHALRWALGHSLTLFVIGGAAVFLRAAAEQFEFAWGERAVGASMVALALWVLLRRRSETPADHSGDVLFGMGVLHGTAGSASVLLLAPAVAEGSASFLMAYIACFSAGMALAMGAYALLFNRSLALRRLDLRAARFATALLTLWVGFRLLLP